MLYIISIIIPLVWLYLCDTFEKIKSKNFSCTANNKMKKIDTLFLKYKTYYNFLITGLLISICSIIIFTSYFISIASLSYLILLYSYIIMIDVLISINYEFKNNNNNNLIVTVLTLYVTSIVLI